MTSFCGTFTPGPGGVMTDEVGVVTGELELRTDVGADGDARLSVRYAGAEEWYAVTGGHYRLGDASRGEALHAAALAHLTTGGADAAALPLPSA